MWIAESGLHRASTNHSIGYERRQKRHNSCLILLFDSTRGPGEDNRGSERAACTVPHELGHRDKPNFEEQGRYVPLERVCNPALRGRHSPLDIGCGPLRLPCRLMGVTPTCGNPGESMQIVEKAPHRGGAPRAAAVGRQHPRKPASNSPAKRNGRARVPGPASSSHDDTTAPPAIEPNRLLAALSSRARAELLRDGELVTLAHGHRAYEARAPITELYFPQTAVFSMVREMTDGAGIEVGTIGREGIVGGSVLAGATSMSTRCIVQIPGRAWRIATPALRAAVDRSLVDGPETEDGSTILGDLLQRYAQALFEQVSQTAACNRLHALEQRCARWLLMTHDRVDGDEIPLTQEFLSYMLGVRRAGVTEACGTLQRSGLIRYRHGHITVVDRAGLEAATCECYAVAADAYTELLGTLIGPTPATALSLAGPR